MSIGYRALRVSSALPLLAILSGCLDVKVRTDPNNPDVDSAGGNIHLAHDPTIPRASSISPVSGPTYGGQTVSLRGTRMSDIREVLIGGIPCSILDYSPDRLRCSTGPNDPGTKNIETTDRYGRHQLLRSYVYEPQPTITFSGPKILSADRPNEFSLTIRSADGKEIVPTVDLPIQIRGSEGVAMNGWSFSGRTGSVNFPSGAREVKLIIEATQPGQMTARGQGLYAGTIAFSVAQKLTLQAPQKIYRGEEVQLAALGGLPPMRFGIESPRHGTVDPEKGRYRAAANPPEDDRSVQVFVQDATGTKASARIQFVGGTEPLALLNGPAQASAGDCARFTFQFQSSILDPLQVEFRRDVVPDSRLPLRDERQSFFQDSACQIQMKPVGLEPGRELAFYYRPASTGLHILKVGRDREGERRLHSTLAFRASPGQLEKLSIIRGSEMIAADACAPFEVQLQDAFGNPMRAKQGTDVHVGTAGEGKFYYDAECSRQATSPQVPAGESSRVVYFKSPVTESTRITAYLPGTKIRDSMAVRTGFTGMTSLLAGAMAPKLSGREPFYRSPYIPFAVMGNKAYLLSHQAPLVWQVDLSTGEFSKLTGQLEETTSVRDGQSAKDSSLAISGVGLVAHDGWLYHWGVTPQGGQGLRRIHPLSGAIQTIAEFPGEPIQPVGFVLIHHWALVQRKDGTVFRYSIADGTFKTIWNQSKADGIARDEAGNLYVQTRKNSELVINRIDLEGRVLAQIVGPEAPQGCRIPASFEKPGILATQKRLYYTGSKSTWAIQLGDSGCTAVSELQNQALEFGLISGGRIFAQFYFDRLYGQTRGIFSIPESSYAVSGKGRLENFTHHAGSDGTELGHADGVLGDSRIQYGQSMTVLGGETYFVDFGNHAIRRYSPHSGKVSTLLTLAQEYIRGLTRDEQYLYFGVVDDFRGHAIIRLDPKTLATKLVLRSNLLRPDKLALVGNYLFNLSGDLRRVNLSSSEPTVESCLYKQGEFPVAIGGDGKSLFAVVGSFYGHMYMANALSIHEIDPATCQKIRSFDPYRFPAQLSSDLHGFPTESTPFRILPVSGGMVVTDKYIYLARGRTIDRMSRATGLLYQGFGQHFDNPYVSMDLPGELGKAMFHELTDLAYDAGAGTVYTLNAFNIRAIR